MISLPAGCKAYGSRATNQDIRDWFSNWTIDSNNIQLILVLAGTKTSEIDGISAAGLTPISRRYTALADAELFLNGFKNEPKWPLPALPAGISPALISHVAAKLLRLDPLIISAGLFERPTFPHLLIEEDSFGPSNCISQGKSMKKSRVNNLLSKSMLIGKDIKKPLVITECVPGGTTTAQAILTGLGIPVGDFIGSSVIEPPLELKKNIVQEGLNAAQLEESPLPEDLMAAVGDPFQPVAVGLLLGAREAEQPVLLGGGSQMLAILALAITFLKPEKRLHFLRGVSIGTTAWLAEEKNAKFTGSNSSFVNLIRLVENHLNIEILAISSGLRFHESTKKVLRDYEIGYIKEGVGAGALVLLSQLNGVSCRELVDNCEKLIDQSGIKSEN